MPWAPKRYCAEHGCGTLVVSGRCSVHRAAQQEQRDRREVWRDYGPEWQRVRKLVLNREPSCRMCGQPATVVDHILPLRDGGTHAVENLRPLCKECHDRRTAGDTLRKRR